MKMSRHAVKRQQDMIKKHIGVAGFEPTTSPTPRVRATRLRYTPVIKLMYNQCCCITVEVVQKVIF